ncbi:putative multidrug export ATP-binding/permease protein [Aliarcobacter thereius]|uniref:ABC transporter ATP-binding protein n=1 Tax=Aliarcobacter thereius TaxID=544718 RepID=UPI00082808F0|nr:ABC transporter ATP-binding protein [Aliarcobacter thereius]OCL85289.1 putative multidrug export ATP-binding/permease protein [Aliarcobacter thereius]
MSKEKISSFWDSYKITLEVAGNNAYLIKRSYLYFILSFIFQGLAFAFFYPLLNNIFASEFNLNSTLFWFFTICFLTIFSLIFRWKASHFNYSGDLVDTTHNLRVKLGEKIKSMPLQKLYQYRSGELNSILAQNVDDSVLHMGIIAGMFFEVVVIPLVIILATFFINPTLSIALLIAIFLSIPIYKWYRKGAKWEKIEGAKAHARLEADTVEYIQGLPVLRAVNQVGSNAKNLQKSIENVRNIQKKGVASSTIPMVVMNSWIEFIFLTILAFGSFLILGGELTIASLITLLILLARINEPLSVFLAVTSMLDTVEAGFRNIKKLLNIKEFEVLKPIQEPKNFNISFENVSFTYENSENSVLKDINLTIKENSLTAIVGASGSGKTTITKLIMRYDDPFKGVVKIGDIDIRNIEPQTVMAYISIVFQDVYLFDDTILNNIRMGKPNSSDEEVLEASKKAFAHEFVSRLPKGYDTKVGDIGGSLSGGERQRISIARAILKNAPIVILDEPTSALDTQSEVAVQSALDELIKDKTVIVIAHRLSTISHADNILVIENGKLKESGIHQELVEKKGKYYSMLKAQQRVKEWNINE